MPCSSNGNGMMNLIRIRRLLEEGDMPAYLIADVRVNDEGPMEEYRAKVSPSVEAAGGRYLVRGGKHDVLEGDWSPTTVVVIEFPSMEALRGWYGTPEYQ